MRITNVDTDIILYLIQVDDKGGASTTDLAKALFNPDNVDELRKHDNAIRYRLKRLCDAELVDKNDVRYKVNPKRVFLTRAAMHLEDMKVDVSMGNMLVLYPVNESVIMRQIAFINSS